MRLSKMLLTLSFHRNALADRAQKHARISVVGPQAADLRAQLMGGPFHQPGYTHEAVREFASSVPNPSIPLYI